MSVDLSTWWRPVTRWAASMLGIAVIASCSNSDEQPDTVRKSIGSEGGLISSHDNVLTISIQPGALSSTVEVEIFPSNEPPLIFGPAYRVKPDIELAVDADITYRRVLPNNIDGVAVAAIRLEDYSEQMGYWSPLPRLSVDEASQSVLATDSALSLYYGMVEMGGSGGSLTTVGGTGTDPSGTSANMTAGPGTGGPDPSATGVDTDDPTTSDPTMPMTMTTMSSAGSSTTDPTSGMGCGDGSADSGELCYELADFGMAGGPVDVAVGDFDGNNNPDIATANGVGGSFAVRLGDGNGGFGAEQAAAAGNGPTALAAADFDGDNNDDLVVALNGDDALALLQSQGDGTLAAFPVPLPAGSAPAHVEAYDLIDDAAPDILVTNSGTSTLSLFPFGAGGVGGELPYETGMVGVPVGIAIGSFNSMGDNLDDAFVFGGGNWAGLPGAMAGGLNGAQVGGAVGTDLRRAIGGELGGSANADAAVADAAEGGVHVMLGDGTALNFDVTFYATGAGAVDVVAADVNNDGDLDLIVANSGAGTVTVLEKTGNDTWGNAMDFNVGGSPSGLAVADFNGDDVPDIAVSNTMSNNVTVLVSNP